jgi:hypothetical protein
MTLAELKARMTIDELGLWRAYVDENGPLFAPLRLESAVARAVLPFLKKGSQMRDLMPWPRESKRVLTTEEAKRYIRNGKL